MKTIEELKEYLINNKISVFDSKTPGVICIDGKLKSKIEKIDKIINNELQCWESFYNNKWTTFLKDPKKSIKKEDVEDTYLRDYDDYDPYDPINYPNFSDMEEGSLEWREAMSSL